MNFSFNTQKHLPGSRVHEEMHHPVRYFARLAMLRALNSGALVRQPCAVCSAAKVEAHHEDYSDPLKVTWLCRLHHQRRHVEMRREALARGAA